MLYQIIILIFVFILGYVLGRVNSITKILFNGNVDYDKPESFFSKTKKQKKTSNITIDERKYVTEINTDTFTKNFDELGDKTSQKDDILNSINKLKNLKKK